MTARTIDTGTDHLLARVEDRVATLTMNRPERRNAFSDEMLAGLARALEEAETAHDVGCVVADRRGRRVLRGRRREGHGRAQHGRRARAKGPASTRASTRSASRSARPRAASTRCRSR